MKKLLIIFAASILGMVACNEERVETKMEQDANSAIKREMDPIFWLKIEVYGGTRKNKDSTSGDPCGGRSICIVMSGGNVISGGVLTASHPFDLNQGAYQFTLEKYPDGTYDVVVNKGIDISPSLANIIFEGNIFVMDSDYHFPQWVCDEFGVSEIILPAGTRSVIETPTSYRYTF
jgi:hypothetical protein